MKILYIATSFPEPDKGASIYTDLAQAIHKAGHEITVAVSEQKVNRSKTQAGIERGFEVLRVVTGNYYDVGLMQKGITALKIPVLMRRGIRRFLKARTFDLILLETPPVTIAGTAAWAKKHFNCPSFLMLKDIFPQNAVDLGIMKKGDIAYRYFAWKEKKLYSSSDRIGCMSPANKEYVKNHNPWLSPDKLCIFPNTKKLTDDYLPNGYPMREKYGIPKEARLFLFGGNMGRPQYIPLYCHAITALKEEKNLYFLFVGRGTDRYLLEQTIREHQIKNAAVIENLPREQYEQISKECDVGFISLDPRFTIPNFPSRILTYMEYAKPVLAALDNTTDLSRLIEDARCGQWVSSWDTAAFVEKIKEMAQDKNLEEKGINGRNYIMKHFEVTQSVRLLEQYFGGQNKK